jgi:3D (Asp-Asp-Asp) domain-containing protein
MNEEKLIKTVNSLLLFATVCIYYGLTYYVTEEHYSHLKRKTAQKEEIISTPTYFEPRKKLVIPFEECLKNVKVPIYETYTAIETEYIGEYFVTAYCSEECGWSTTTSSGEECEYHEEWYIPTTAAIDLNYHRYGEYLMIENKIYRTADTGPGVRGRWVDCYVPDMSSVYAWDTGWKSVHRVTFTEKQIKVKEVTLYDYYNTDIYSHSFCGGSVCRDAA